jgi:hypothetical protein
MKTITYIGLAREGVLKDLKVSFNSHQWDYISHQDPQKNRLYNEILDFYIRTLSNKHRNP